jgi:hypothetical protein
VNAVKDTFVLSVMRADDAISSDQGLMKRPRIAA